METSKNNYKVVMEFGNGKHRTKRVKRLEGLLRTCRDEADEKGTSFMYARIYPDSELGSMVIQKGCYMLDKNGLHHYFGKKLIKL